MTKRLIAALLTAATMLVSGTWSQQVIQCPNQNPPLSERWKWAAGEGARSAASKEFSIGYCIKRLMKEDSYVNSGSVYFGGTRNRRSIYDILSGNPGRATVEHNSWRSGDRASIIKVMKEVALLFKVLGNPSEEGGMQKLEVSNMELSVDLKDKPLLWLGGADDDQSVGLLKEILDRHSSIELKKELITAIGLHQNSKESHSVLAKVLQSDQPENLRSQAAFWIGQQDQPGGLALLVETARNDHSTKVKEEAVFAVSQISSDESTEALIDLARKATDSKIRAKAAFWLGQKASQKVVATLQSIIADDEQTDVQRQALFALAQIRSEDGVDRLIKIAQTHQNPRIRKQAIQCLGQSDDPRALDALIAIVRK